MLSSLLGLGSVASDHPATRGVKHGRRSTREAGRRAERLAVAHYLLRGYRVLGRNVWAGGYEVDLIVRRGRAVVFCEVKSKSRSGMGDPLEMVGPEKLDRMTRAASAWLASRPDLDGLGVTVEVLAVRGRSVERVTAAM